MKKTTLTNTRNFRVTGMTCAHCEHAVESAVSKIAGTAKAKARAAKKSLSVEAPSQVTDAQIIAAVQSAGYEAEAAASSDVPSQKPLSGAQFIMIAIASVIVLLLINRTIGFASFPVLDKPAAPAMILIVGLLTSIHCIAMCGGINLSQCLTKDVACANRFSGVLPATLYNGGRVISYTISGAIIGALGNVFNFSPAVKAAILIVAGVLMLFMGLSFTGLISTMLRIGNFSLPEKLSLIKKTRYTPFIVGLASAFIPCGPLQAMQLYTLGSGSAFKGGLSMFIFAIGTVPLPFALGAFSSLISKKFTGVMFKAGGYLIILLAFLMISNGIALSGMTLRQKVSINPSELSQQNGGNAAKFVDGVQRITTSMNASEYESFTVHAGIPLEWTLIAKSEDLNGCNGEIVIPEYKISKRLSAGENLIKFTPKKSGTIAFSCWMGMIKSSIRVIDAP